MYFVYLLLGLILIGSVIQAFDVKPDVINKPDDQ